MRRDATLSTRHKPYSCMGRQQSTKYDPPPVLRAPPHVPQDRSLAGVSHHRGIEPCRLVLGEYRPRGPGACMPHCCYTVQVPRDTVHLRLTGGSIIAHVRETFVAAVCNVQRAPCHIQQTACERARSNLRRLDCAAFPMRGLTPSPGSAHRTVLSCNPCLLASARAWHASLCVCVRARRARVAKGSTSGGSGQH